MLSRMGGLRDAYIFLMGRHPGKTQGKGKLFYAGRRFKNKKIYFSIPPGPAPPFGPLPWGGDGLGAVGRCPRHLRRDTGGDVPVCGGGDPLPLPLYGVLLLFGPERTDGGGLPADRPRHPAAVPAAGPGGGGGAHELYRRLPGGREDGRPAGPGPGRTAGGGAADALLLHQRGTLLHPHGGGGPDVRQRRRGRHDALRPHPGLLHGGAALLPRPPGPPKGAGGPENQGHPHDPVPHPGGHRQRQRDAGAVRLYHPLFRPHRLAGAYSRPVGEKRPAGPGSPGGDKGLSAGRGLSRSVRRADSGVSPLLFGAFGDCPGAVRLYGGGNPSAAGEGSALAADKRGLRGGMVSGDTGHTGKIPL